MSGIDQRDDEDRDAENAQGVAEHLGFRQEEVVCELDCKDLHINADAYTDTVHVIVASEAAWFV